MVSLTSTDRIRASTTVLCFQRADDEDYGQLALLLRKVNRPVLYYSAHGPTLGSHMKAAIRALAPYLIAVLVLSSIDISYEWLDPLPPSGESTAPTEWYSVAGLRMGVLVLFNREPPGPAAGLSFDAHLPEFIPLPFDAGAGPEGGAIFISVWFIALLAWVAHMLWRGAEMRTWLVIFAAVLALTLVVSAPLFVTAWGTGVEYWKFLVIPTLLSLAWVWVGAIVVFLLCAAIRWLRRTRPYT